MLNLSLSNKLGFEFRIKEKYYNYSKIISEDKKSYVVVELNQKEYSIYNDLIRYGERIIKNIKEIYVNDNLIYLLFEHFDEKTDQLVKIEKMIDVLDLFFEETTFEIKLSKKNIVNMDRLYQILDSKFIYFEMLVREVETSPFKNDNSWIILSKYNIILDAKIILYDLQQDLFKLIDQEEIIKYGLIYKNMLEDMYKNGKIFPFFDLYYGPKGLLYARYFLSFLSKIDFEKYKKKIEKLDVFNQKYFCFMTIYVLILNLYFDINKIVNYLNICKYLRNFINIYGDIVNK